MPPPPPPFYPEGDEKDGQGNPLTTAIARIARILGIGGKDTDPEDPAARNPPTIPIGGPDQGSYVFLDEPTPKLGLAKKAKRFVAEPGESIVSTNPEPSSDYFIGRTEQLPVYGLTPLDTSENYISYPIIIVLLTVIPALVLLSLVTVAFVQFRKFGRRRMSAYSSNEGVDWERWGLHEVDVSRLGSGSRARAPGCGAGSGGTGTPNAPPAYGIELEEWKEIRSRYGEEEEDEDEGMVKGRGNRQSAAV